MELSQIEAFVLAARERSFTRAADVLGLTQPSVSARIALLETELGGPVFERGSRSLRLTPLGRAYLPYAERALGALEDGREAAHRTAEGSLGHVRLAAVPPLVTYMLSLPLERFRADYPAVDITFLARRSPEILAMLHSGETMLGLLSAPVWDKATTVYAHFREAVRPVCAPDHPLAQQQLAGEPIHVADIYDHTLFRTTLNPIVTAFIQGIGEHARRGSGGAVITLPALMVLRPLVLGQGIAFLSEGYVARQVGLGNLMFLDFEDMPPLANEVVLIGQAGREPDPPTAAFIRIMRAEWHRLLVR
ncbi:MAG TPA: LysR family transcriptional regulator [Aggregatilinea sp.]|jgi:DNA-binding transcriptional LysR family regulator|uniref:LysR family transcriptional regulator n=1 Tax=Aggregatilinea TaxID=2806306 RepID=UPI0013C345F1|nr:MULTISPECIES: LysR family transcriptional regulator [Aggregatilinea]HML21440.1 LysR family transcriptional regulator [Aggregatilinea sp.]